MTRGPLLIWLLGWQCVLFGLTAYAVGLVGLFIQVKEPQPIGMATLLLTVGAMAIDYSGRTKGKKR